MKVSPRFFEKLIELKGWTPYIKGHELTLSPKAKGKYILSFKERPNFETTMLYERANKLLRQLTTK